MALQPNVNYAIVNNITGAVLQFEGGPDSDVIGWEWEDELDQQWQLGVTGVADRWTIINQETNDILRPQPPPPPGAVGAGAPLIAQPGGMWQFFVAEVPGGFTIRTNGNGDPADLGDAIFAVNIVPDGGAGNIFGNGASVGLVPLAQAQVWSFVQPAPHPIQAGTYTIRNILTGTVLGLPDNNGNIFVTGQMLNGGGVQRWHFTRNPMGFWRFQNQASLRFLAPELDIVPPAGTRLVCVPNPQGIYAFTIEAVPGTNDYQILSNGLAVNIVDGVQIPPFNPIPMNQNDAPAVLQDAAAQTWAIEQ